MMQLAVLGTSSYDVTAGTRSVPSGRVAHSAYGRMQFTEPQTIVAN